MSKTTVYLLIISLFVLAAWLGFEIYHRSRETTLPEIVQQQIEPVDPNLPTKFLEALRGRYGNRVGEELKY